MLGPHFLRDNHEVLFVSLDRFSEGLEQGLCIDRIGDDPGVQLNLFTFGIELTEVEQKFDGVIAYLEVVGIAPFEYDALLGALIFMIHGDLNSGASELRRTGRHLVARTGRLFDGCCHRPRWLRGHEAEEVSALTAAWRASGADGGGKVECNRIAPLRCGCETDTSQATARHDIDLIAGLPIAVVIEHADYGTELQGHCAQAGDICEPNGIPEIDPVLIPMKAIGWGARFACEGPRLKEVRSPGRNRDRGGAIGDGHRAGWIEDAIDGWGADIDDLERAACCQDQT